MKSKVVESFQVSQTEQRFEIVFWGVSPNYISPLFFLDHFRNSVSPFADYPFILAPYIFAGFLQWVTPTMWNADKTTATLISSFSTTGFLQATDRAVHTELHSNTLF